MTGYTPGEPAALAVYVGGTVEAVTADTITIGGGVRTLSTSWPEATLCDGDCEPTCARDHCDDCDGDCCTHTCDDDAWRTVDGIDQAVERAHDDAGHAGPYRYCTDPICTAVREAGE